MALNAYLTQVQLLLHDSAANFYSTTNLTTWVNAARQKVAQDGECVRVLPPNSGGITAFNQVAQGSNYSATPTATLSAPQLIGGVQATAGAVTVAGGHITAIAVGTAGSGYVIPPGVTITDPTGSGANYTTTLAAANYTVANQEIYTFSSVNTFVQATSGVQAINDIKQVAVYWGNMKPALRFVPWTIFNAYFRAWPQFSNFPQCWSKYGQGQAGTLYFWPIPSQVLGMDWDTICMPVTLTSDSTPEAIPAPFTDAIQYYAAYLALLYAQRKNDALDMEKLYKLRLTEARASTMRSLAPMAYAGV